MCQRTPPKTTDVRGRAAQRVQPLSTMCRVLDKTLEGFLLEAEDHARQHTFAGSTNDAKLCCTSWLGDLQQLAPTVALSVVEAARVGLHRCMPG